MRVLRTLPAVVACVLLAAHFLRLGGAVAAAVTVALPLLLLLRRRWAVRTVQIVLALGAAEWIRTLVVLVDARRAAGLPSIRLAAILVAVTVVTAAASMLLAGWCPPRRRAASAVSGGAA